MLIGRVENIDNENISYHSVIKKVLQYLKETDFKQMTDGDYKFEEDGIIVKLQRYETRSPMLCKPETHNKYIDIQFIVEGAECVGWCPLSPDLKISEPYDSEKDVTFYEKLIPESSVILSDRHFAVLYPDDVHRPCGYVDELPAKVTKVVVKIPLKCLMIED